MDEIAIPCPACERILKIRDRGWLGKKGKCPKCGHAFVLQEPEEVQLELAPVEPVLPGADARWVPDEAPTATPAASKSPVAAPQSASLPAVGDFAISTPPVSSFAATAKRRRRKGGLFYAGIAGVLGAAVGIGYVVFQQQAGPGSATPTAVTSASGVPNPAAGSSPADVPATGLANHSTINATTPSGVPWTKPPTEGSPITLKLIPAGTRTVIHLRPAELWKTGSAGEEFRFALGPVGEFLDQQIRQITRMEPAQLAELTICLIPGPRGQAPSVAAVFQLAGDAKRSELLEKFGGERIDTFEQPIYVLRGQACLIADEKTVAICPEIMGGEMVSAAKYANPTSDDLDELLQLTDVNRHITVLFEPMSLRLDAEAMVPSQVLPFFTQALDWLGEDIRAASWSLHLGNERFYSELVVRNDTMISPRQVEEDVLAKISNLPQKLLTNVRKMNPREQGKRQIIGRVPAMSQAIAMATVAETGPRYVRLVTAFPERAAPNLALGTLLAWDESTRTDFTQVAMNDPGKKAGKIIPEEITARLKLPIDADFRRTPLQEAFAYIGEEIQTKIEIDGDGLKSAGYTKNMPQTFQLTEKPAAEVIQTILKQYEKMCIVVQQDQKRILVTTLAFAEQQKLTPYQFP